MAIFGKECAICGTKLVLLNQSEYNIAGNEKICLDCRAKIFKASGIDEDEVDKTSKAIRSRNDKTGASAIVGTLASMAEGNSFKDAIGGTNTEISNLFKSKNAEEWREIIG